VICTLLDVLPLECSNCCMLFGVVSTALNVIANKVRQIWGKNICCVYAFHGIQVGGDSKFAWKGVSELFIQIRHIDSHPTAPASNTSALAARALS